MLNASFFKQLEDNIESYPTSRVHLHSLDSLDEDLKLQSYSVHGFDLFAFKRNWWLNNNHLFPDMYLGKPYWDTVYFIKSVLNSNFKILNKQPQNKQREINKLLDLNIEGKLSDVQLEAQLEKLGLGADEVFYVMDEVDINYGYGYGGYYGGY